MAALKHSAQGGLGTTATATLKGKERARLGTFGREVTPGLSGSTIPLQGGGIGESPHLHGTRSRSSTASSITNPSTSGSSLSLYTRSPHGGPYSSGPSHSHQPSSSSTMSSVPTSLSDYESTTLTADKHRTSTGAAATTASPNLSAGTTPLLDPRFQFPNAMARKRMNQPGTSNVGLGLGLGTVFSSGGGGGTEGGSTPRHPTGFTSSGGDRKGSYVASLGLAPLISTKGEFVPLNPTISQQRRGSATASSSPSLPPSSPAFAPFPYNYTLSPPAIDLHAEHDQAPPSTSSNDVTPRKKKPLASTPMTTSSSQTSTLRGLRAYVPSSYTTVGGIKSSHSVPDLRALKIAQDEERAAALEKAALARSVDSLAPAAAGNHSSYGSTRSQLALRRPTRYGHTSSSAYGRSNATGTQRGKSMSPVALRRTTNYSPQPWSHGAVPYNSCEAITFPKPRLTSYEMHLGPAYDRERERRSTSRGHQGDDGVRRRNNSTSIPTVVVNKDLPPLPQYYLQREDLMSVQEILDEIERTRQEREEWNRAKMQRRRREGSRSRSRDLFGGGGSDSEGGGRTTPAILGRRRRAEEEIKRAEIRRGKEKEDVRIPSTPLRRPAAATRQPFPASQQQLLDDHASIPRYSPPVPSSFDPFTKAVKRLRAGSQDRRRKDAERWRTTSDISNNKFQAGWKQAGANDAELVIARRRSLSFHGETVTVGGKPISHPQLLKRSPSVDSLHVKAFGKPTKSASAESIHFGLAVTSPDLNATEFASREEVVVGENEAITLPPSQHHLLRRPITSENLRLNSIENDLGGNGRSREESGGSSKEWLALKTEAKAQAVIPPKNVVASPATTHAASSDKSEFPSPHTWQDFWATPPMRHPDSASTQASEFPSPAFPKTEEAAPANLAPSPVSIFSAPPRPSNAELDRALSPRPRTASLGKAKHLPTAVTDSPPPTSFEASDSPTKGRERQPVSNLASSLATSSHSPLSHDAKATPTLGSAILASYFESKDVPPPAPVTVAATGSSDLESLRRMSESVSTVRSSESSNSTGNSTSPLGRRRSVLNLDDEGSSFKDLFFRPPPDRRMLRREDTISVHEDDASERGTLRRDSPPAALGRPYSDASTLLPTQDFPTSPESVRLEAEDRPYHLNTPETEQIALFPEGDHTFGHGALVHARSFDRQSGRPSTSHSESYATAEEGGYATTEEGSFYEDEDEPRFVSGVVHSHRSTMEVLDAASRPRPTPTQGPWAATSFGRDFFGTDDQPSSSSGSLEKVPQATTSGRSSFLDFTSALSVPAAGTPESNQGSFIDFAADRESGIAASFIDWDPPSSPPADHPSSPLLSTPPKLVTTEVQEYPASPSSSVAFPRSRQSTNDYSNRHSYLTVADSQKDDGRHSYNSGLSGIASSGMGASSVSLLSNRSNLSRLNDFPHPPFPSSPRRETSLDEDEEMPLSPTEDDTVHAPVDPATRAQRTISLPNLSSSSLSMTDSSQYTIEETTTTEEDGGVRRHRGVPEGDDDDQEDLEEVVIRDASFLDLSTSPDRNSLSSQSYLSSGSRPFSISTFKTFLSGARDEPVPPVPRDNLSTRAERPRHVRTYSDPTLFEKKHPLVDSPEERVR